MSESAKTPNAACDHEVHVTLTVAIPGQHAHHSLADEMERVIAALQQRAPLPDGSHLHGEIVASVRTTKQIAAAAKRAEARRKARGYA